MSVLEGAERVSPIRQRRVRSNDPEEGVLYIGTATDSLPAAYRVEWDTATPGELRMVLRHLAANGGGRLFTFTPPGGSPVTVRHAAQPRPQISRVGLAHAIRLTLQAVSL